MKRYFNCYTDGYVTVGYRTAEEARQRAHGTPYAVAVEVELPDSPHEWKVGDWFLPGPQHTWSTPTRIVDIAKGSWAGTTRSEDGEPRALDGWTVSELDEAGATPCDPPAWFTEGGAS